MILSHVKFCFFADALRTRNEGHGVFAAELGGLENVALDGRVGWKEGQVMSTLLLADIRNIHLAATDGEGIALLRRACAGGRVCQ